MPKIQQISVLALALGFLPLIHAQDVPSVLQTALKVFMPAPVEFPQEEYDGFEIRYNRFVFRPAMFQTEAYIVGFILAYTGIYFIMSYYNTYQAKLWISTQKSVLTPQFSSPGEPEMLMTDGASDMFLFSTGRRNVQSLHTVFTFIPRHDLVQLVFTYGWTLYDLRYTPDNDVTLDFKLGTKGGSQTGVGPSCVWAVVEKDELKNIKTNRWDLTMAKAHDNALVPKTCVVMTEVADVTDALLKNSAAAPLLAAFNDPKIMKYFKSLSVTDLPSFRPTSPIKPDQKERHVILSFKLPSSSSAMHDTTPLVKAVFGFIDALESGKVTLRPETTRKLKTARDELEKELVKDATEEKVKEAEESKRAAKRRAEEERIAKLSAEQQRKIREKEKKRSMKKATTKVRMG
ncbi:hypothetical protein M408DRAFT_328717 [Serendipita vermifera MAFF 305830]|uniref:DUF1682-domain-containing protein n=1 Tax=Serendipita vermifera MAFF 305830 TaxID=933852 RepID=A0A0C2XK71_SERVB|nr:hypothetical protein M408DRAFT_328717 [Serendipita vermifera MAFF 305830]